MGTAEKVVGCILAGGQSRRFNFEKKGLQQLGGITLVERVIKRFQPQVSNIYINTPHQTYQQYQLPLISDESDSFDGPLAGLTACLEHCKHHHSEAKWLAIAPCDAPFLPKDMVQQLLRNKKQAQVCLFSYQQHLQPTFSLWHVDVLDDVRAATTQHGMIGFKQFLQQWEQAPSIIEHPKQEVSPFYNINTPEDLSQAETLLDKSETF